MAAQKNYGFETSKAIAGAKADLGFDDVVTRTNEGEDGTIKFGMAVKVGTTAGTGVALPSTGTTADKIEGVVLYNPTTEYGTDGKVVIKKNANVGIMRKGRIWARTANGITPKYGEKAYVIVTDGENAGTFTNVQDSNVDIGATFGKYTEDGLAIVELK